MRSILASLGVVALAAAAQADVLVVPLAGWQADDGYGAPTNTFANYALPVGTTIDAVEYVDLTYTANSPSWRSELALSVNDSFAGVGGFYDALIVGAVDSSGVYGPISADFADGDFIGGPFVLTTGDLYVEAYDIFPDAVIDQQISAGELHITYTVPEPASLALLGLAGLAAFRRR